MDRKVACFLSASIAALISLALNGFNTISGCLRDKRWNDVPDALNLYVNPGSAVETGLRRRRAAEIQLWVS